VSTLLIYTGGTIGMVRNPEGSLIPFPISGLLSHMSEFKDRLQGQEISFVSMEPLKDSSNFTPNDWLLLRDLILVHHENHDNVLVLHGTDTMAYTASATSFLLSEFDKNIVFTGAQLPIGQPNSDGESNLIDAFALLNELKLKQVKGKVLLSFGGKVFKGNRVSKLSSVLFDGFYGDQNVFKIEKIDSAIVCPDFKDVKKIETNVTLIKMHPGIQLAKQTSHLIENLPRGIILESFGTGNIPQNDAFINGLEKLIARGVMVLNISQCLDGHVDMGTYLTGIALRKIGVIDGKNMTTEAALSKLMLVLSIPDEHIADLLANSIAGEIIK
jgi:L-asparaginase